MVTSKLASSSGFQTPTRPPPPGGVPSIAGNVLSPGPASPWADVAAAAARRAAAESQAASVTSMARSCGARTGTSPTAQAGAEAVWAAGERRVVAGDEASTSQVATCLVVVGKGLFTGTCAPAS